MEAVLTAHEPPGTANTEGGRSSALRVSLSLPLLSLSVCVYKLFVYKPFYDGIIWSVKGRCAGAYGSAGVA